MINMLLDKFKMDLVAKNRAKNTLKMIDFTLGKSQEHLGKPLEALSIEELKTYFKELNEKGLTSNTIELFQQKFIQFYNWCFDEMDNDNYGKLVRQIKVIKLHKVKKAIEPKEILSPEEVKRLINVATLERDRCIVAVLFESGMRLGELLSLTIDMVEMDEIKQEVHFNIPNQPGCMTGARSVVCLEIYGYVQDWIKCNPSKQFIPIKPSGVRKVVKRLFKKAGIIKPCNIHHFRHSAIVHAVGLDMSQTHLSYRFWGIPHSAMLSDYINLNRQLKAGGYSDAKSMGDGNCNTVINPLASKCVECGRLVQSGNLCKICTDSKKLSLENEILKLRLDEKDKDYDEIKKQIDFITLALQAKELK